MISILFLYNIIFNMSTQVKCIHYTTCPQEKQDQMRWSVCHLKGDAENSATTIHHSSLAIYISFLGVKKALCITKFIVLWFAISINLLGKSHQSVP